MLLISPLSTLSREIKRTMTDDVSHMNELKSRGMSTGLKSTTTTRKKTSIHRSKVAVYSLVFTYCSFLQVTSESIKTKSQEKVKRAQNSK